MLTLNIGNRANLRNLDPDNRDEEVTVRPVNGGGKYSVTGFGLTQTYGPGGQFSGPAVTKVVGNGGRDGTAEQDGSDKLLMLPGGDEAARATAGRDRGGRHRRSRSRCRSS